jgi:hypothetical protein
VDTCLHRSIVREPRTCWFDGVVTEADGFVYITNMELIRMHTRTSHHTCPDSVPVGEGRLGTWVPVADRLVSADVTFEGIAEA